MENKLLNDQVVEQVRQAFGQMKEPVQILYFGSQQECDYCEDTLQLLREVVALSDKLGLSEYDLAADAATAEQYKVDKAPGFVLAARDGDKLVDYGVRFAGIPAGHEFGTLINDLLLVSGRDSQLTPQTRQFLSKLDRPVLLQVFVTPT